MRREEEILTGMAETDERAAQLPEMDQAIKKAKADAAQFEKESQGRVAGLQEQSDKTQQRLQVAVSREYHDFSVTPPVVG